MLLWYSSMLLWLNLRQDEPAWTPTHWLLHLSVLKLICHSWLFHGVSFNAERLILFVRLFIFSAAPSEGLTDLKCDEAQTQTGHADTSSLLWKVHLKQSNKEQTNRQKKAKDMSFQGQQLQHVLAYFFFDFNYMIEEKRFWNTISL